MGQIIYKKMSLFDAPEGSIIAHGCNSQGVWGSGIAAPFKEKYPRSFIEYNNYCQNTLKNNKRGATGTALITSQENKRFVGCLMTSFDFGKNKDSVNDIIYNTVLALDDFFKDYNLEHKDRPLYCNKFNSGMFKVPWSQTEDVLRYFSEKYNVDITVCNPDL